MQRELFPKEVTTDVPRIILTGRDRLLVEQHKGLEVCTASEIGLRTSCGCLSVTGNGLLFLRYTQTEALITGRIDAVRLDTEGRHG